MDINEKFRGQNNFQRVEGEAGVQGLEPASPTIGLYEDFIELDWYDVDPADDFDDLYRYDVDLEDDFDELDRYDVDPGVHKG